MVNAPARAGPVKFENLSQPSRAAVTPLPRRVEQIVDQQIAKGVERPLLYLRHTIEKTHMHQAVVEMKIGTEMGEFVRFVAQTVAICFPIGQTKNDLVHIHCVVWHGVDEDL